MIKNIFPIFTGEWQKIGERKLLSQKKIQVVYFVITTSIMAKKVSKRPFFVCNYPFKLL